MEKTISNNHNYHIQNFETFSELLGTFFNQCPTTCGLLWKPPQLNCSPCTKTCPYCSISKLSPTLPDNKETNIFLQTVTTSSKLQYKILGPKLLQLSEGKIWVSRFSKTIPALIWKSYKTIWPPPQNFENSCEVFLISAPQYVDCFGTHPPPLMKDTLNKCL